MKPIWLLVEKFRALCVWLVWLCWSELLNHAQTLQFELRPLSQSFSFSRGSNPRLDLVGPHFRPKFSITPPLTATLADIDDPLVVSNNLYKTSSELIYNLKAAFPFYSSSESHTNQHKNVISLLMKAMPPFDWFKKASSTFSAKKEVQKKAPAPTVLTPEPGHRRRSLVNRKYFNEDFENSSPPKNVFKSLDKSHAGRGLFYSFSAGASA